MNKEILMTSDGLKKLEEELENLKVVKRKEIAEKIKVALSYGDLSENSEYDDAKNEQAIMEARIAEVEAILKNAKVIDETHTNAELVHVGSKVRVYDFGFEEEVIYRIVGSNESDPINGLISDESPVGKALVDHKPGDKVEVDAPEGLITYEILEIIK